MNFKRRNFSNNYQARKSNTSDANRSIILLCCLRHFLQRSSSCLKFFAWFLNTDRSVGQKQSPRWLSPTKYDKEGDHRTLEQSSSPKHKHKTITWQINTHLLRYSTTEYQLIFLKTTLLIQNSKYTITLCKLMQVCNKKRDLIIENCLI